MTKARDELNKRVQTAITEKTEAEKAKNVMNSPFIESEQNWLRSMCRIL